MPKKKDRSKTVGDLASIGDIERHSMPAGSTWAPRRIYKDEGVYTGPILNGKREGRGRLYEKSGYVLYEGDWKNDKPCGYGKRSFPNSGDRHEGGYLEGERHGLGVYLWANGDKYSGEWNTGLMHGRGKFEWALNVEAMVYTGMWDHGRMSGEGVKLLRDGSRLEGKFEDGVLNGWGSKRFSMGDRYKGNFNQNMRADYGEYSWVDGSVYKGFWWDDEMHGLGQLTLSRSGLRWGRTSYDGPTSIPVSGGNGMTAVPYVGRIENSIVMYWGEFRHGRFSGSGTARLQNGTVYTGAWTEDEMSGWGRLLYAADKLNVREVYEGEVSQGERHGLGQFSYVVIRSSTADVSGENSNEEDNDGVNNAPIPPATSTSIFVPQRIQEFDFEHALLTATSMNMTTSSTTGIPETEIGMEAAMDTSFLEVESILRIWGGSYRGYWVANSPHGAGVIELLNGQRFEGIFNDGHIAASKPDTTSARLNDHNISDVEDASSYTTTT